MKILIDARLYGLENAGLGRYIINLVEGLSRLDNKNKYSVLLTDKYFRSLTLPVNWKKIRADFRHYSFAEQVKIPDIIKNENPDVTHFPHFNVPLTFKGNFVVTIHDLLMHKNVGLSATTLLPPMYLFKRLGYKTIFRKAVLGSQNIIVPSEAVKKEVIGYYKIDPEKIKVIYEGIDEKIGSSKNVREKYGFTEPYFIYTGNAYPHKNLKRLVEAVVLLNKNTSKKVILAIVSARNVFTDRLLKMIKKEQAQELIKLLGFVPDDDLGSIYKNSLAFVFPSISEGFGLPGLEALGSGTLLLASDIPVFKEIYKDNAIYFNPFDFTSIEKSLQKAIEISPPSREEKIKAAKDFVKRYSWSKMAEETLNLYESCVGIRQNK